MTCRGDSIFDPVTRTCVCPEGKSLDAQGNCIIGCGVNQVFKNGACCCKTGYYPVNGVCGQCQWNEVYDKALGICRVPCDAKRIFDISLQKCVCLPHFWELADGTCGTCPVHSTYYERTKSCVCDAGFALSLGICVPKCNSF